MKEPNQSKCYNNEPLSPFSDWLTEHPEASYNPVNSPHLRPAFLVDRVLWYLNNDILEGRCEDEGVPTSITDEQHLKSLTRLVKQAVEKVGHLVSIIYFP